MRGPYSHGPRLQSTWTPLSGATGFLPQSGLLAALSQRRRALHKALSTVCGTKKEYELIVETTEIKELIVIAGVAVDVAEVI